MSPDKIIKIGFSFLLSSLVLPLVAQPSKTQAKPAQEANNKIEREKEAQPESGESLLQNVKIPYNPVLIRDPFASPTDVNQSNKVESIDEISIKGRVQQRNKSFAIITDSRGKTRMVPVGYRFKDGEIVSISDTSVTFRQWDPNSVARSAVKTVVKSFKREEDKR